MKPVVSFALALAVGLTHPPREDGRRPGEGVPVPRKIIVLYDSTYDKEVAFLPVHQIAEMPMNHLGLVVTYVDITRGLPSLSEMRDVRGVLTWFSADAMKDPIGFLKWSESVIDAGKKFAVIGDLSVSRDFQNRLTPLYLINRFWAKLGLKSENDWNSITYDWDVAYKDASIVGFERERFGVLPAFSRMKKISSAVTDHLVLRRSDDPATDNHLVVTHKHGAYAAGGYMHFSTLEVHGRQWFVNPFEFFRLAFATDNLPKPDTTTVSGRRIFYSHIDGDGWRNVTEVLPYRKARELSAQVILKEVIETYGDLPVTIAPIAADIDPNWHGTKRSQEIARQILAHPHVEAGSHTYAHPLTWSELDPEGTPAVSREAVHRRESGSLAGSLLAIVRPGSDRSMAKDAHGQSVSYPDQPFDLAREIGGAAAFINALLPPGKRVAVIQWSGDTQPFQAALKAAREAGLRNINGGDTRLDPEFQSYGWVAPLSRQVGKERQIYASNSNENTYTNLWTDRFFGFKFLVRTIDNTESPTRIKPYNVYYHMYSGEKLSSLLAVQENYNYARTKELAPVTTSRYAAIVDGFFATEITSLGTDIWRITNRDRLATIRFDHATLRAVDFSRSSGVTGQRHHQGSLYISLDPDNPAPVVALQAISPTGDPPSAPQPYLIHGRWEVSGLSVGPVYDRPRSQNAAADFSFKARGFGAGEMFWQVPRRGTYRVRVEESSGAIWEQLARTDSSGMLKINLGSIGIEMVRASVFLFQESDGR